MRDPAEVLARRRTSYGPGLPLKVCCAVLLLAAVAMAILRRGDITSAAGIVVCPLLALWLWLKNSVRFELDAGGVAMRRRGKSETFPWTDIVRVHAVASRGGSLTAGYRAEVFGKRGALFHYTLWTDGARELTAAIRAVIRKEEDSATGE